MRRYASGANDHARTALIAEHVDVAKRIALRVARNVPSWISKDDLVATAMIGLTEAADRYDAARGEPFVAFAERRIRGAVLDELRKGDILPRRVRTTARKVGNAVRVLETKLGRSPEDHEIAAELGVPLDTYREDLEMLSQVSFVELTPEDAENLRASEETSPATHAERREMTGKLRASLDRIPKRDAQIMALYYVEELTYAEIGQVLGVSESRVCQLHSRALARLRVELDDLN